VPGIALTVSLLDQIGDKVSFGGMVERRYWKLEFIRQLISTISWNYKLIIGWDAHADHTIKVHRLITVYLELRQVSST
jgi:hypothetical protein